MMSNKLENFIEQNKDALNDYEPSAKLWDKLQKEIDNKQVVTMQQATVKKLAIYKWVAAASVTLLIAGSIFYFTSKKEAEHPAIVNEEKQTPAVETIIEKDTNTIKTTPTLKPQVEKFIAKQSNIIKQEIIKPKIVAIPEKKYDEVYAFKATEKHFATLISFKEKEIKNFAKTDPEAFKSFSADMEGLNKTYKQLNTQLPKTNNKSALINAMIYNLQIQIDLLNKQLIILNKIESSQKKQAHEKNILSI
jgi:hypothetical protein